ncbi:MAG: Mut7-C RNAse domain-containing protein [Acidobacteriota bacterium]|nr:Mut7-C RNAse domain-containing protein [Acidobacteriota bacterium]
MSGSITIRFHTTLNVFLNNEDRERARTYSFIRPPSIKDVIESRGVPHAEVRVILADGRPVLFDEIIETGRHYDIFPPERHPPVADEFLLPFRPEGPPRFVLDVHLGILARSLRMLGFDSFYRNDDPGDKAIAAMAYEQNRIALSRDIGLLKRSAVTYGYWVRARASEEQLREVIDHYRLAPDFRPFTRCMNCNQVLAPVEKQDILHYLPERVKQQYDEFVFCADCDQCYWKGSHFQRMQEIVAGLT